MENVNNDINFARPGHTVAEKASAAAPMLSKVSNQARDLAKLGMDTVDGAAQQARAAAAQASDTLIAYTRENPVKALAIAAAAGAVLLAIVKALTPARD